MSLESVLRDHFFRFPDMQIKDVYKLLHQAALGSEHAILTTEGAKKWLEHELVEMGSGADEVTIDPISPDGRIVRVHLRPFVAQGGDPDALFAAFIRTANEFRGDKNILEDYWKVATSIMQFSLADMDGFFKSMREKDYPAVHHSSEYEKTYRPAYRVVLREFLNG